MWIVAFFLLKFLTPIAATRTFFRYDACFLNQDEGAFENFFQVDNRQLLEASARLTVVNDNGAIPYSSFQPRARIIVSDDRPTCFEDGQWCVDLATTNVPETLAVSVWYANQRGDAVCPFSGVTPEDVGMNTPGYRCRQMICAIENFPA